MRHFTFRRATSPQSSVSRTRSSPMPIAGARSPPPRPHARVSSPPNAWPRNTGRSTAIAALVPECNDQELVRRTGPHPARNRDYRLFFHDTHHRAATDPDAMAAYDLSHYDGVLAYGAVIRDIYRSRGWAADAWTWHEAADV